MKSHLFFLGVIMRKLSLLILILSQFLGCQNNNKEDIVSIFTNLSLFLFRANKLTLSGTAVKGIVKNAVVTVTPLEETGCEETVSSASPP